jgi:peptide/nickel transport system substrate-binding protein
VALACAGLCLVSACGGSSSSSSGSAAFDAGNTSIVNASDATGGTLNYGMTNQFDSVDPGNTYYAFSWNFSRLYAVPLLSYNPAPGKAGENLVPGLATGMGTTSADGLTWTYHIKSGMKFADGEPITSADVKYAVERTFAKDVLPNGPAYFQTYLANAANYPGPYKDKDPNGLAAIETPDDTTVVFHLSQKFSDFNYLVANPQTAPVPPAKDTGANYQTQVVGSGPYTIKPGSVNPTTGFSLIKNPYWKSSNDPYIKQTADQINVSFNLAADDLDNRLLSGSIDLDLYGTGLNTAARSKVLSSAQLKKNTDAALSGFLWYYPIDTQVIPNVDCRKAIEYAADKTLFQNAYGGDLAGGDIASTVIPPNIIGYNKFDDYEALTQPGGDIQKAKDELAKCGKPTGFSFNVAVRGDRPKEVASAQALQTALAKVGIKIDILQYPTGQYGTSYIGSPSFMQQHNIGMGTYGWEADWPDGFGFLYSIASGNAILQAGNSNISMLNDPEVNNLLNQAAATKDQAQQTQIYQQIDKIMMDQATVLPEVYAKSLLYRPSDLTNVYVSSVFGMYDYTQIGKKSS